MALSVEKLLTDAHMLITRLKSDDSLADNIIGSSQALLSKVEAMKQYQDDITELNEIAKHRPRSTLVLGIAQENRQIRQLQQENRELEASLEEHQSALELIMQKYREHTVKLLHTNQIEKAIKEKEASEKNSMCRLMDKIDEMAGVMQKAIEVDETHGYVDKEKLRRMEVENRALREMLEICTTSREPIVIPPPPVIPSIDANLLQDLGEDEKEEDEKADEEEEEESETDTSTLTRSDHPSKLKKEDEDDADSSTLTRRSASSSTSLSSLPEEKDNENEKEGGNEIKEEKESGAKKEEKEGVAKKEEKEAAVKKEEKEVGGKKEEKESVSKSDEKKESPVESKTKTTESKKGETTTKAAGKDTRSGSKSPVASKSTGDFKKTRISSSPVKKTSSLTSTVKKDASGVTTVRKSSSSDLKKDVKGKGATAKTVGKK